MRAVHSIILSTAIMFSRLNMISAVSDNRGITTTSPRPSDTSVILVEGNGSEADLATAYFQFHCHRVNILLDDQSNGFYLSKAVELTEDNIVNLMNEIFNRDIMQERLLQICSDLRTVARIGYEAFTQGWSYDTQARANEAVDNIRRSLQDRETMPMT